MSEAAETVVAESSPAAETPVATEKPAVDFYEVLQISPNADPDTVQRVFRLLAQLFHPDNTEQGANRFGGVALATDNFAHIVWIHIES